MPQAQIEINAIIGSDDDLPINTLVALDNNNIGGEVSFLWSILDQPAGPADLLSNPAIQTPTFTPTKEGTYLIQLIVNDSLPTEDTDSVIAAVRQLKTRERVPAAGEQVEDNPSRGWAEDTNTFLRTLDGHIADPGTIVGVNNAGTPLLRGVVVRVTSSQTIKTGLPGEEDLPGFSKALATAGAALDEQLLVVVQGVDGSDPVPIGGLTIARFIGMLEDITIGAGVVGDSIFVSDTATLSVTPGTNIRQVGSIAAVSGADRDIWFSGSQGGNQAPVDRAYLVYGNPGPLTNALRVDGLNAGPVINNIPVTFRGGDLTTVPLVAKKFSAVATADLFQVQDETGTALVLVTSAGIIDATQGVIIRTGLQVGFAGTPTDDRIDIGDNLFFLDHASPGAASLPLIQFDTNDLIIFNRTTNALTVAMNSLTSFVAYDFGIEVREGMRIGFLTGVSPGADTLEIGDSNFRLTHLSPGAGSTPTIQFDGSSNRFEYNRSVSAYQWFIAASSRLAVDGNGVTVAQGLVVGHGGTPVDDEVSVGSANFALIFDGTDPTLRFDTGVDQIFYDRSDNEFEFQIGGAPRVIIGGSSIASNALIETPSGVSGLNGAILRGESGVKAPLRLLNDFNDTGEPAFSGGIGYRVTTGVATVRQADENVSSSSGTQESAALHCTVFRSGEHNQVITGTELVLTYLRNTADLSGVLLRVTVYGSVFRDATASNFTIRLELEGLSLAEVSWQPDEDVSPSVNDKWRIDATLSYEAGGAVCRTTSITNWWEQDGVAATNPPVGIVKEFTGLAGTQSLVLEATSASGNKTLSVSDMIVEILDGA